LHEEGGFRYSVARDDLRDPIVGVLSESFAREPMSASLDVSASRFAPFVTSFMPECTSNGLSVIATPDDEPDTVAGVFISRDFKAPLPPGIPDDFPWFFPIAEALVTVDEAYEAMRPGLELGDAVDLWMVGVQTRFAGNGIASTLFRVASDLARDSGFKRCVTECTGQFSQHAARKSGFQEVTQLAYRDVRFEGKAIFADIDAPHTHIILFEKEF
jgi:GNAT superfamily N-acetyltransferase